MAAAAGPAAASDQPQTVPVAAKKAEPPTKRGLLNRGWFWVAVLVGVVVIANSLGDGRSNSTFNTPRVNTPTPTVCQKSVVYYVEGTARSVSITMENRTGGTEQADNRAVPLAAGGTPGLRLGQIPCGQFVYISAQNEGETGTVTCRIEVDGVTLETATSSGAYVIATCSGSVPG